MLTGSRTDGATGLSSDADWRNWLENDRLLTPGLRESYRRTLEGFEEFCRTRRVVVTRCTPWPDDSPVAL